ncbi:MAG TPA: alpha/beta fold hydrolase [Candidatus Chromulinivoraceae bacterium]|nr:alpha/beta fold hydrolase [Candidatus Chromulinivoraceae bacterium]
MTETEAKAIAIKVAGIMKDERFKEVESLFSPQLRAVASAETVHTAWSSEVSKSGAVTHIGESTAEQTDQGVRIRTPVVFEHGELVIFMSIDDQGLLNGLRLAPAAAEWSEPSYAKLRRFTEHEVTVTADSLDVGATISIPVGSGPYPGVVLLGGGGPFDRDETDGANKPLKDIAWGLASRGIAVLRFDKVNYVHSQVAASPKFTMMDEYVPHAVAGVHMLQQQRDVDIHKIFILGHSMGGKVAPQIAAAEPSVAGLVIMAGDAQPMQQAAVRVARYVDTLNSTASTKSAVATIEKQAALVDSSQLSISTPASELPFGFSGAYWLSVRDYDPVATAVALEKPMFILQGGRDYQVTVEDDLSRWKAGLSQNPNVKIRIYKADNHLFFPGKGRSTPAEYGAPQHVDPAVVADIARWLQPQRGVIARFMSMLSS